MEQGETKLRVFSSYDGNACIKGCFFRGPCLPENSTGHILITTDQGHESQIAIEKGGKQEISLPVVRGVNWVSMRCLDEPSVVVSHDPRSLLVSVRGLSIKNGEYKVIEKTE